MKNIIIALVVAILFASTAFGADEKVSPKIEQISKQFNLTIEDATLLYNQLQEFAKVMGVSVPAKVEESPPAEAEAKMTGAEVANKALDLATQAASVIAAQIEKVAPEVWRIMVTQQYANGLFWMVIPLGLIPVSIFYWRWSGRWEISVSDSDLESLLDFLQCASRYVFMVGAPTWFVIAFAYALRHFVNPEYYAIRDMFEIMLGS